MEATRPQELHVPALKAVDECAVETTDDAVDSSSDGSVTNETVRKRPRTTRSTPRKRGKPTYYLRKDEIGELQHQVELLQAEMKKIKEETPRHASSLVDAQTVRGPFVDGIERNHLTLAGTQSLLAASTLTMMNNAVGVPLATTIHLPIDELERDQILRNMREPKLQAAYKYMAERVRCLDLRIAHRQGECFDYPNGDAANTAFEVIPFDSTHSLRDVYNEFQFWMRNQEISISEKMGVITVRESDDLDEFTYGQSRLLTTVLDGVEIESNLALFTACEDASGASPGYAISAIDFVNHDELHPYRTTQIGRKEMTAAVLLVEVPTASGERAVSLCRWSFIRFCGPTGGLSTGQQSAVRDTMIGLCDMMAELLTERLAMRALSSPVSAQTSAE